MTKGRVDAVGDQSTAPGTSDFVIDGVAVTGMVAFAGKLTDGYTYDYRAQNADNTVWEVGTGTWTAATSTLSRTTVYQSSNGGAKANFTDVCAVVNVVTASDLASADPAAAIHAASSKATPVDADEMALVDSEASFVLKNLTWANLKATAKTYFDTLYASNAFKTIAVSGQSDVVADSPTDTLTLVAGSGITLTTNASTDTVTITGSGSGLTVGTTTITSGTSTRLLYDNAGVVGESTVVTDGSGNLTIPSGAKLLVSAGTGVAAIQIGGTSGSFVGLAQAGTTLEVCTASYSAYATVKALGYLANSTGFTDGNWTLAVGGSDGSMLNAARSQYSNMRVGALKILGLSNTTVDLGISRNAANIAEMNTGTPGTLSDLKVRGLYWSSSLTVGTLPAAATAGDGATFRVSDLTTPTLGAAPTGSGAVKGLCTSNGSSYTVTQFG